MNRKVKDIKEMIATLKSKEPTNASGLLPGISTNDQNNNNDTFECIYLVALNHQGIYFLKTSLVFLTQIYNIIHMILLE